MSRKKLFLLLLGCFIVFLGWRYIQKYSKDTEEPKKETVPVSSSVERSPVTEDERISSANEENSETEDTQESFIDEDFEYYASLSEEMLVGDSGIDEDEYTIHTELEVPEERSTKSGFQEFVLAYSNTQNYTKDGFNFGYAEIRYEHGVSADDSAALINGMGNAGYLVWLLRNTFGICDEDFVTPLAIYGKSPKVDKSELQIGDLGFITEADEEYNFCGICVGFVGDEPVFSIMDGSWFEKFPYGTNRLCYIKSGIEDDRKIDHSRSVSFGYFCRPELPWHGEDGGFDLSSNILVEDPEIVE